MTLPDIITITGFLGIALGCWLIGPWLALIVGGALLLVIGVVWSRNNARKRSVQEVNE